MVSSLYCALESIHAALAIMAQDGMPKQIYKEEVFSLSMRKYILMLYVGIDCRQKLCRFIGINCL